MTNEEILKLVEENYYKYFSFELGRFRIPNKVGPINVQELRTKLLSKRSSGELRFIKDFKDIKNNIISNNSLKLSANKSGYFYEQFPIIIDNRNLWLKCCEIYGMLGKYYLDENKNLHSINNKKMLFPDLYLPFMRKVIEVDYASTHNSDLDGIRDLYLWCRYEIETIRIKEYQSGKKDDNENKEEKKLLNSNDKLFIGRVLENTLYETSLTFKNPFDYLPFYIEDFKKRFKSILEEGKVPTKEFYNYLYPKKK